jgi:parvulin-like peptidyl-prolyl isomerase
MIKTISTRTTKSASIKSAAIIAVAAAFVCVPVQVFAQSTPQLSRTAQTSVRPKPAVPVLAPPPSQITQGTAAAKTPDAKAPESDNVIARVGSANVSAEDIRAYIAALGPREQAALAQDPALLSQAVRLLLANRLVLQELLAKKWDQQPGVIAQLDRMRDGALAELYLQSVSAPPANFPSDEEVQKTYDANRGALLMPRQFQLAQIFVMAPKDAVKAADDNARKSLDDIQRKLKLAGADFAAIAAESGDKSDGNIGWVVEDQIRPEIRAQVMGLAKSAISEPIRLDDGWHIIKVIDTKASYTRTLPEVHDQLVQQMRTERATALRRAYLAELLKQHPPVLNELALSNLLDKSSR